MNSKNFIKEMGSLISKLKETEFDCEAEDLSDELKEFSTFEMDSDLTKYHFEEWLDLMLEQLEDYDYGLDESVIRDITILYYSIVVINNGFALCQYDVDILTAVDYETIGKIVGNKITFDSNKIIISNKFLDKCVCLPISKDELN